MIFEHLVQREVDPGIVQVIELGHLFLGIDNEVVAAFDQASNRLTFSTVQDVGSNTTLRLAFDALNDVRNLSYSGRCITEAGLNHEVTITLMELPPGCTVADKKDKIRELGETMIKPVNG